jgi:hypothetical protein
MSVFYFHSKPRVWLLADKLGYLVFTFKGFILILRVQKEGILNVQLKIILEIP